MRAIRQIPFQRSPMHRFIFDRADVIEATKARIVEMRAEITRVELVLTESIQKHGLDPAKALKRLDNLQPYGQLPEVRQLVELRVVQTSITTLIEEYETFISLASDPRCKGVGLASMVSGATGNTLDLDADEAKFLLHPFDGKAFAESLKGPEDTYTPGIATALGDPMHAMPAASWSPPAPQAVKDLLGE